MPSFSGIEPVLATVVNMGKGREQGAGGGGRRAEKNEPVGVSRRIAGLPEVETKRFWGRSSYFSQRRLLAARGSAVLRFSDAA